MFQKHLSKNLLILCLLLSFSSCISFKKKHDQGFAGNNSGKKGDSTHVDLKPYNKVITDKAVTSKGLITVHKIEDKYFFEINDSLMNAELLVMARLSKAAADVRTKRSFSGFAGDPIGGSVISFEKGPNDKLFIKKRSYTEYAGDSTSSMYMAVRKNNLQPIVASFPIAAVSPDSSSVVVDMTNFINQDNDVFFFGSQIEKQMWNLGGLQADKSYIEFVHSYPENTEIRTVRTYELSGQMMSGVRTFEVNTSIVLLPRVPMKGRLFDERVGYFTTNFIDYDSNPQRVEETALVNRWRLEPKPEDVDKYLKGELVEPKKPIVFYIDPATPEQWVPYLIEGVNDWNKAFEAAGFKNAIMGKRAPTLEEDSTFSLEDARHSAIVYKPSPLPNASGPSVADPRSGEIIESHINWYHNIMSILRDWYMIQAGPLDPRAQMMNFDPELMGQLIRFVCSHEVGHTLGLRHNFGSSSTVPVEKLRDREWLEKNGHTPSIMDYARFNYVAQPEDNVGEKGIFPRVNDYDFWAIEWGYRWYPQFETPEEEVAYLNQLTIKKLENKRLWFGTEIPSNDPRNQSEDLGDNAMKAGAYGIKNLKRVIAGLPEWTKAENEGYENLSAIYKATSKQFDRYIMHVMRYFGGVYNTPKTQEQGGPVFEMVPASKQREAMAFLDEYVFTTPMWLYNEEICNKIGFDFVYEISQRQKGLLNNIVDIYAISDMLKNQALSKDAYTLSEFFDGLNQAIFREVYKNGAVDMYRRNLQKIYTGILIDLVKEDAFMPFGGGRPPNSPAMQAFSVLDAKNSDSYSEVKSNLRELKSVIDRAIPRTRDRMTKEHLLDLSERIENYFEH